MEFVLGIILLALNIWAIINVWTSGSTVLAKALWTIGIFILPLIGFIAWYIAGPKGGTRAIA